MGVEWARSISGGISGACTVPNTVSRSVLAKSPQAQAIVSHVALVIGVAAISLPASDRQHELDAGPVRHLRQSDAVGPTPGPALRHHRDRAAGGAVVEPVGAAHCSTLTVSNFGVHGTGPRSERLVRLAQAGLLNEWHDFGNPLRRVSRRGN